MESSYIRREGRVGRNRFIDKLIIFFALIILLPSVAQAADRNWQVSSGGWSTASNWGGSEPTSSDNAHINNGGTANVTASGEMASNLYIGNGTLNMTGGALTVGGNIYNDAGNGTIIRDGGTLTLSNSSAALNVDKFILGNASDKTGSFTLSGSRTLTAADVTVGKSGKGTLTQSAGMADITNLILAENSGSTGTYNLNGGTLNVTNVVAKEGDGTLKMGGGAINVFGDWDLSSGSFTPGSSTVNFKATSTDKTIDHGSNQFKNVTFDGLGGGWTLQSDLTITGNFTLSNGTLNTDNYAVNVGTSASADFLVSGGIYNGGDGTLAVRKFDLTGGIFNTPAGGLTVRNTFTKTGGTFNANNAPVTFLGLDSGGSYGITSGGAVFKDVTFDRQVASSNQTLTLADKMTVSGDVHIQNHTNKSLTLIGVNDASKSLDIGGHLIFQDTPANTGAATLGSTTAAEKLTVNLGGDLTMSDANATLRANLNFTGTGDQTITKTNGTVNGGIWTVDKPSGSVKLGSNVTVGAVPLKIEEGIFNLNGFSFITSSNVTNDTQGILQGHGVLQGTGVLTMNGRVIADGGTLSLTGFSSLVNSVDNPLDGNRGWYATHGGRLDFAAVSVPVNSGAQTFTFGESVNDSTLDLVNSVRLTLLNVTHNGTLSASILAVDESEVPDLPEGVFFSALRFEPAGGLVFGSANLVLRYDDERMQSMVESGDLDPATLRFIHFKNGEWENLESNIDTVNHTLSVNGITSFSFFAVAGDSPAIAVPEIPGAFQIPLWCILAGMILFLRKRLT